MMNRDRVLIGKQSKKRKLLLYQKDVKEVSVLNTHNLSCLGLLKI